MDHPDALAVRGGIALFAAPGNVPVIFDNEGVSEVVGDLSGRCGDISELPISNTLVDLSSFVI